MSQFYVITEADVRRCKESQASGHPSGLPGA
jgi:hypothetical protein